MKFRFQSFFDVSTSASTMQVLQFSVGGPNVLDRCRHLFGAYKYFKLGKISVKMVPASTLPVDPQGLSYDADDPQTVDPRDQMNPGLVRITNGEDIFLGISELTDEQQIATYNSMMIDPRWSKFMLQSGFRRVAYPLYWQVGQLSQDKYPGSILNLPSDSDTAEAKGISRDALYMKSNTLSDYRADQGVSSARGLFQVGHKGRLGFLPTDYYQYVQTAAETRFAPEYGTNNIPQVKVITCVLPKAYKTLYFYRIFVTEEVIFSGLRSAPFVAEGQQVPAYCGLDNFIMGGINVVNPGRPLYYPPSLNHVPNDGQNGE